MVNELIAQQMRGVPYRGPARISHPQQQLELVLADYLPRFSFWFDPENNVFSLYLGNGLTKVSLHEPILEYSLLDFANEKFDVTSLPELLPLVEKAILKLMKEFVVCQEL